MRAVAAAVRRTLAKLPRLGINRWTLCVDDGEFEGWTLWFNWLDIQLELSAGRHNGSCR